MSITSTTQVRTGNATQITVVSSLTGTIYYHWYQDGSYLGVSSTPTRTFVLVPGSQARFTILDTNDAAFDPVANAPEGYPATRSLVFTRSIDSDVSKYRIEQQRESDGWISLGIIFDDPRAWVYQLSTPTLDDLTNYGWRVIAIDTAGNDGTAVTLAAELIVRTPNAPDFTVTFDPGTTKVTFAAA
jgi:hypothetical protein